MLIATGKNYWRYILPMVNSAAKFMVSHEVVLFTDNPESMAEYQFAVQPKGFPRETLYRFHTMLSQKSLLSEFDQMFYSDVDMMMVGPVGSEIFSDGITATLHPGYVNRTDLPYERRPESAAAILGPARKYYCGGFNGGSTASFLAMAETIKAAADADDSKGVRAVWNDESHLNHYLYYNPPAKELSPSYCYPQDAGDYYKRIWGMDYEQRLVALWKEDEMKARGQA